MNLTEYDTENVICSIATQQQVSSASDRMSAHHGTIVGLLKSTDKLFVEFGIQKLPLETPDAGEGSSATDETEKDVEIIAESTVELHMLLHTTQNPCLLFCAYSILLGQKKKEKKIFRIAHRVF